VSLGASDLLVVPEIYAALLPSLPRGVRHVIFNQGPFLTFEREPEAVARHYASSPDLLAVLTVSRHAAELLAYAFPGHDVRLVRNEIDPAIFHPAAQPPARTIAYMPRRGAGDAALALQLLEARGALTGWRVQALEGLSQAGVADALRRSSIFLSFAYQEGFGLPPVEAMACGNLVVGYHGISGQEFFLPQFSRAVPTGDVLAVARAVEDVLDQERRDPGCIRARGLAASRHVLDAYSPERSRADLLAAFGELLGAGGPRRERSVAHA
jgi:glycosyltransferase involved in cell wall biosynthesis